MSKRELAPAYFHLRDKGVTQAEAADILGIGERTGRLWEAEKRQKAGHPGDVKLAEISGLELNRWTVYGPLLRAAVTNPEALEGIGYRVWESFEDWVKFYAEVREAWLLQRADRDLPEPAAERLYQCWLDGDDVNAEWEAIQAERSVAAPEAGDGAYVLSVPVDTQPWPTLGPLISSFIQSNLCHGPGDLRGERAILDDEKRWLVNRAYEVFPEGHPLAGRRRFKRVALSLAKGTAKTEFSAWVAALELHPAAPVRCIGWANGQPVGGPVTDPYIPLTAYTSKQSDELAYSALKTVLEESPIADDFNTGLERILRATGDGRAVSLASSPNARDGARTTFQVFDETHRWQLPRLKLAHETMMRNIPKRRLADAWSLEVTTSFEPGAKSIAEDTMTYARQVDAGEIEDSTLFFFHRQASADLPLETLEDVRKAVIAASGATAEWRDIDSIVDQWRDPTTDRKYFQRVWLNQPIQSTRQAFDINIWNALATDEYLVEDGDKIALGFDGSRNRDSTALIATHIATGFQWVVGYWRAPTDPHRAWDVPVNEVDAAVRGAFEQYDVWRLYADPFYWGEPIAKWSGEFGTDRIVKWSTNSRKRMSHALQGFATAIAEGEISHDGNPHLAEHLGNAHKREVSERDDDGAPLWLIQKDRPDSPFKIDLAMAAVLSWQARIDAIAAGMLEEAEPSVYESRGLLVLG